jgi:hypothetical protein
VASAALENRGSLTGFGETPDEDGWFMAAVHETVIDVCSGATGLGTSALSSFVSGEERILDKYDGALDEARSDPALGAIPTRQKHELQNKMQDKRRLSSSAA